MKYNNKMKKFISILTKEIGILIYCKILYFRYFNIL